MKAAVYKGSGNYIFEEMQKPECPDDGLVIRVAGCTICGTDLKILKAQDVKIEGGMQRHMRLPRVTGHELAGVIAEVGRKTKGFAEGDRVTVAVTVPCGFCRYCLSGHQEMCDDIRIIGYDTDGGFAEFLAVDAREIATGCVIKIPDAVTLDAAALTEPLSCVVNCLEISPAGMGDAVVVIGAGAMGCFFVNLARMQCAGKVVLADISEGRLAAAGKLMEKAGTPADAYVNTKSEDLIAIVRDLTGGRGADLVITACPSAEAQIQAVELAAKRGRVNFFGGLPRGNSVIQLDSNLIHYKECSISGTHGSAPRHNRIALELIAAGIVPAEEYITHRFGLSEIMQGVDIARSGEGIKVLIKP